MTERMTGKNLVVEFGTLALTTNGRAFSVTMEQEQADATAGADTYRVFVPTVKTVSASIELLMARDEAGEALIAAVQPGTAGALMWYPDGKVVGKPVWGFTATVSKADQSLPFDDVAVLNVEFVNTGSAMLKTGEDYANP